MTNNKAFSLIIGSCLIGAVLGLIPSISPFRQAEVVFAKLAVMAMLTFFIIKDNWIKIFVLWVIARTLMNANPYATTMLNVVFLYAMMYQVLADNLNKDRCLIVMNVIGIIAVAQGVMMVAQYNGLFIKLIPSAYASSKWITYFKNTALPVHLSLDPARWRIDNINGFTSNSSMGGMLLALSLPALLRKWWCLAVPLSLWGIAITSSMTAIIPAILILIIYGVKSVNIKYKVYIVIGIIYLICGILCVRLNEMSSFISTHGRFELWTMLFKKYFTKHWVIGWGVGSVPVICQHAFKNKFYKWVELFLDPHNEYLVIALETGIVGLFLVISGLINHIKILLKNTDSLKFLVLLGIISGAVSASANFTLHVTEGILFIVYLSMAQSLTRESQNETTV